MYTWAANANEQTRPGKNHRLERILLNTAPQAKPYFLQNALWPAFVHKLHLGLFLGWVLLLIRPAEVPDPLGLDLALSWTAVCLLTVILVWVPDLVAGRWPATRLDRTLVMYVAIVVFTAIPGVNRHSTLVAALALLGNIGIFYATVMLARRTPGLTEGILLLLAAIIALLLMMAHAYHSELGILTRPKVYSVPEGWAGYPELGTLAVVQFGILVAGLMTGVPPAMVLAISILVLVNLAELVFLYSRATWPTAAGLAILATVLGTKRQWRALLLVGGLMAATSGIFVAANPTFRGLARIALWGPSAYTAEQAKYGLEIAAPEGRIMIWKRALQMIGDHPLFGVGLGNFREVFEREYNPEVNPDGRRGVHAHNLWLQQAAELGVIGGIGYFLLWTRVLILSWRAARLDATFASFALLLSLAGMAASNLTTNMFYLTGSASGRLQSLTWMLFGLVAAMGPRPRHNT